MKGFSVFALILELGVVASTRAVAQSSLPPIRQLGPVTAVAKDSLGAVSGIRALPGGRLLVNDIIARRGVLFDSPLPPPPAGSDTTRAPANAYGRRGGGPSACHRASSPLPPAAPHCH